MAPRDMPRRRISVIADAESSWPQPPDTPNHHRAVQDGFQPVSTTEATRQGDLVAVLLPDERLPKYFLAEIRPHLAPGKVLIFAHGFNVRFGQLDVPDGVSTVLVAPLGPGPAVRAEYIRGRGVPCLIAVDGGAAPDAPRLGTGLCQRDRRHAGQPSSRPRSPRRPKPICSANRPFCAADSARWCRPRSRR